MLCQNINTNLPDGTFYYGLTSVPKTCVLNIELWIALFLPQWIMWGSVFLKYAWIKKKTDLSLCNYMYEWMECLKLSE